MDKWFSIGEVSKLHNVSVQTLRYYDKIGLLTPSYVNETTGYRYYSKNHFMMIGFIKQCKTMGLTLEEIKELVNHYTSIEAVLQIISTQKELFAKKIEEMIQIQNNIEVLQHKIQQTLSEGISKVFISTCPERCFVKYNTTQKYTEAFEIKLTEVIKESEVQYGMVYKELVFATDYSQFKKNKKTNYNHMMIACGKENKSHIAEYVILPAGDYLTLNFDDDFKGTSAYYNQLTQYIDQNHLQVGDTFYETYMITRVDANNRETSLGKIQIQVLNSENNKDAPSAKK
ncbi:MAG: MerR family transcriptional regulator [Cellulosilyticaceae bacterium]